MGERECWLMLIFMMVYDAIMPSKATLILDTKTILQDGRIMQRKLWQLPKVEPGRPSGLKYRLYCGQNGQTIQEKSNEAH